MGAFARELREGGVRLLQYRDKQGNPQEVLRAAAEISAVFAGSGAMMVMNDRADLAVLAGWRGCHVGHLDMPVQAVRRVLAGAASLQGLKTFLSDGLYGTAEAVPSTRPSSPSSVEATPIIESWFVGVSTHNEEQVRAADGLGEPGLENADPWHPGSGHPASEHPASGPPPSRGHSSSWSADYVAIGPVFATASKVDAEPAVGLEGVRRARALTGKPLVAIGGITRANARAVIEAGADSVAVIGGLFAEGKSGRDVARDFLRILG